MHEKLKKPRLKFLVAIVDRDKMHRANDIFLESKAKFHFGCLGEGTAASEHLDILGLDKTDKGILFCLCPERKAKVLMNEIFESLHLYKPGTGIVFTIPISGINNPIFQVINKELEAETRKAIEEEAEAMKNDAAHDLVIAVVNQGYCDELIAAAKEAGAFGGTLVHARRVSSEEAANFFGIPMQAEKEIIGILVDRAKKQEIMQAISKSSGIKTEAKGIIFSLPVDTLLGIEEKE